MDAFTQFTLSPKQLNSCRKWIPGERNSDTHIHLRLDPLKKLFLKVISPYPGKHWQKSLQKGTPVVVGAGML